MSEPAKGGGDTGDAAGRDEGYPVIMEDFKGGR
jgi:hypothetical protein